MEPVSGIQKYSKGSHLKMNDMVLYIKYTMKNENSLVGKEVA